jgi:hypothetical protein
MSLPRYDRTTPCRHSAQTNTVLDDVEQLTIRQPLRGWIAHVRRTGIHLTAEFRIPAPIVGVTGGTVVGPMGARFGEDLGVICGRIRS